MNKLFWGALFFLLACSDGHHLDYNNTVIPVCVETSPFESLLLSVENIVEQTGVPTPVQTVLDFDLQLSDSADSYIFGGETPAHLTNISGERFHFRNPGFETSSSLKLIKKNQCQNIFEQNIFFAGDLNNLPAIFLALTANYSKTYTSSFIQIDRDIDLLASLNITAGDVDSFIVLTCIEVFDEPSANTCVTMPVQTISLPLALKGKKARLIYKESAGSLEENSAYIDLIL